MWRGATLELEGGAISRMTELLTEKKAALLALLELNDESVMTSLRLLNDSHKAHSDGSFLLS